MATPKKPERSEDALNPIRRCRLDLRIEAAVGSPLRIAGFAASGARCEVVGEQGTLRLGELEAADFRGRFATAYQRELDAWVSGADGPSTWDGYAANAVADACITSLASGERAEVQLAERPALYG